MCVMSCSLFYVVANIRLRFQYKICLCIRVSSCLVSKNEENHHRLESLMKVTVMSEGGNEYDKKDWMKK